MHQAKGCKFKVLGRNTKCQKQKDTEHLAYPFEDKHLKLSKMALRWDRKEQLRTPPSSY